LKLGLSLAISKTEKLNDNNINKMEKSIEVDSKENLAQAMLGSALARVKLH
jgi:hypothetical protein